MSVYRDVRRVLAPYRQALRAQRDPVGERDRLDNEHMAMFMAWRLRPDSNAVDVGCHEGEMLRRIRAAAPAGRHIAVEPQPDLAARLRTQYPDVTVVEAAASDENGEAEFHQTTGAPGYSSLLDRRKSAHLRPRTIAVRTCRLEDVVPEDLPVDLVKIDVEGAELAALRGAVGLLRRCKPALLVEHGADGSGDHPDSPAIHDLLTGLGYRILDVDGEGPYDRQQFVERIRRGRMWNWVCLP